MRRYELMLLLRPDLEDDKLQAAVEKVTRAIVNGGGSLSKVSPWGKRRLAYDIKRHREASYFLIHFDIEPGQVREIERGMLITEEILRHLVTVLEDRGPTDELAPAVEARSTGDDIDAGQADLYAVPAGAEVGTATATATIVAPVTTEEPELEAPDDGISNETSNDASEDEAEAPADAGPDDEERAEG